MAKYGMPYKGSKDKIAEKIISTLPDAEYFVDLFGGGGAMAHCAAMSGKYKKIIYNELEPLIAKGFKMAVNGDFKHENRWISREEFEKLKSTDPYVAICFSFGNNLKTYAYAREIERFKKHLHHMFFAESPKEARLHWRGFVREFELAKVEINERLERLQSLESLERLQSLEIYNLSYEQVKIPENAVIYCDIPYKNTNAYLSEFDYEKFYKWALSQKQAVFISEYSMPAEFYEVTSWERRSLLSDKSRKKECEKLFCTKPYSAEIQLEIAI